MREAARHYRPVNLAAVPQKVMEKIILDATEKQLKKKAIIRHSQCGLIRGKSRLSSGRAPGSHGDKLLAGCAEHRIAGW